MIKFEDFFTVPYPEKTKVKFNINDADPDRPAWDYLIKGEDNTDWIRMNAHRKKQSSNDLDNYDYLLAFAQYYPYGPNYYIFGGMYKVEKIIPEVNDQQGYNLTLLNDFAGYRRRLIIKLETPIGRNLYSRKYTSVQKGLNPEVYELAPETKLESFPGYNNVLLTHEDLQTIVANSAPEWKMALSNVKGVYCITDTSTGKLYIGSASGDDEGIWQRWASYAKVSNLTGGNKTFEELKNRGANYIIDNFTYSILEIFDMRTSKKEIIQREEFWKRVFQSVKYGMNNVRSKNVTP